MAIGIGKDLHNTMLCEGLAAKAPCHAGLMFFAIYLKVVIVGFIVMEVELFGPSKEKNSYNNILIPFKRM
jgi:hypothetical protein